MEAAFFDLDKTVIARASMVAFGPPLYRAGLISRWLLLRALYGQLVYLWLGADETRLRRMRDATLALIRGWQRDHVRDLVEEALTEVVEPIIYDEALDLMRAHRSAGRRVVLVSAAPEEVVAPLARYLGADDVVATRAKVDADGRYDGELELYAFGATKAVEMRRLADELGLDLEASFAYSDSATDLPMLEAVGHPVAVNPDRDLARAARGRGWEVRRFEKPVRLRERVAMPPPGATAVGGGVAALVLTAVVVWWRLRRTDRPAPVPRPRRALAPVLAAVAVLPWPRRGRRRAVTRCGDAWPPRRRARR